MKLSETTVTLRRLTAADGCLLTQANPDTNPDDRLYLSSISLAAGDSPDNWIEVSATEKSDGTPGR